VKSIDCATVITGGVAYMRRCVHGATYFSKGAANAQYRSIEYAGLIFVAVIFGFGNKKKGNAPAPPFQLEDTYP
jgi:hypothetical protein